MDSFMAMMAHSESFSTTDPSNLTDQELDCLKEAFSLFDADHDGEITVYELGRYFITSTWKFIKYGKKRKGKNFLNLPLKPSFCCWYWLNENSISGTQFVSVTHNKENPK